MTIAIEISGTDDFYYHCFKNIAIMHPEHRFIFIFTNDIPYNRRTANNITYETLGNKWLNWISVKFLHKRKILGILKRNNARFYFCSVIWAVNSEEIKTVVYLNEKFLTKRNKYFELLKNSFWLIAENDFIKNILKEEYPSINDKTTVIPYGTDICNPSDESKKEEVKKTICSGKEYFLLEGTNCGTDTIIEALKSFSYFKKWQQSGFKLIINISESQKSEISSLIKSYKYREDIVLMIVGKEIFAEKDLISSAYALIFIHSTILNLPKVLSGFCLKIPVVLLENDFIQSSFNDNALYYKKSELSEKMILLYKNESLRNDLIQRAFHFSESISWEKISKKIWNEIIEKSQE